MSRLVAKSWQASALEKIRGVFKAGHRAVMLQLPPGLGKTLVAVRAFRALKKKGFHLIIAVPGRTWRQQGSWKDELERAKVTVGKADVIEEGRGAPRACLITHRELRELFKGSGPPLARRWIKERRKLLIVVDEIHRARGFRDDLSESYWQDDDSNLPHLLRYEGGRPPKYPLWLLLSATPYNPVRLDYDIDTSGNDIAPEVEDIEQEADIVADEVERTLGMLGQLAGKQASRDALREYIDQLRKGLRETGPAPGTRPPVAIVPVDTGPLRPRPPKRFAFHAPSAPLEECIEATWNIHHRLVWARRLRHRAATVERLVLGGVRSSQKAKKTLLQHSYTSTTIEAVTQSEPKPQEPGYSVKLESLMGLVRRITRRRNAKVLIFCVHRAVATAVARYLERSMSLMKGTVVDGTLVSGVEELREKCDSFNQEGKPPFILVTTDKLSETIDLHRSCEILVHFELPWSPLRVLQRVGRLWRIKTRRQTKPSPAPAVFHIIHPCSVEEEILNRLHRRWKYLATLGLGYMPIEYGLGTRLPRVPWDIAHDVSEG